MARKSRPSVRLGYASTVTSALLVCVAVAVALLGHIRFKGELHRLDRENGKIEFALKEQRRLNAELEADYDTLVSPRGLEARLRELNLNLIVPGGASRVVLREPLAIEGDRSAEQGANGHSLAWGGESVTGRHR
jgi:hypothetical protein